MGGRMRDRVFADSFFWITEWILLEVGDACCHSASLHDLATDFIRSSFVGGMTVVMATPELWQRSLALYERHSDKQWSLTDCLSFIVMRDNGITKALTGDRHFVQAGFDALIQ